jgi:hypothetical protein
MVNHALMSEPAFNRPSLPMNYAALREVPAADQSAGSMWATARSSTAKGLVSDE